MGVALEVGKVVVSPQVKVVVSPCSCSDVLHDEFV